MFVGIHAMLAMQTGVAELAISDDEGKAFTVSAQNVLRHYSVETTQKTLDWIAFFGTAGAIYLPRIASVAMTRKANKPERRTTHNGKVIHPEEFMSADGREDFVEGFSEDSPSELPN